jgi:hypothetical protein
MQFRYPESQDTPVEQKDGFKNATWTFYWNESIPAVGDVTTQSSKSAGGALERYKAVVVNNLPSFLTFVTPLDGSFWIYSIYPASGVLMASRHGRGFPGEAAVGGTFHSRCKISVN